MGTPAYSNIVQGTKQISSIATLADEPGGLTCSVDVAKRWAKYQRGRTVIRGYPSFEEAATSVHDGDNDALLVPSAYAGIARFFFDSELIAIRSFIARLPDFVLAIRESERIEDVEVIFHHPSIETLVDRAGVGDVRRVVTSSNSRAAQLVKESAVSAAAVTNSLSADGYGLRTLQALSRGTPMSFNVFRKV